MSESSLPENWITARLGDVVDYGITSKIEPADIADNEWVLELEDIEKESSKILQRLAFAARSSKSTKNKFKKGDVLYGKLRPYLSKVVIADADGVCTTEIIPLNGDKYLDNRYLFYWLKHPEFLAYTSDVSHGLNMPRLGTKQGQVAPFVLAPLAEQKQIANKLDELLAQVDSIKTRLDAIPAILKRFRQSVLAAAVSGRLTEDWRENHPCSAAALAEKLRSQNRQKNSRSNAANPTHGVHDLEKDVLPIGWELVTLDECCKPGRPVTYGILKPGPDIEGGVPYIKVRDYPNDQLISDGFMRTTSEIAGQYQRSILNAGDLLLSIRGTVGRIIRIPKSLEGANITQDSARISPTEGSISDYLFWYLKSPDAQRRMEAAKKGVAVKGINIGDVRALQVALPPSEEQLEIVSTIEKINDFSAQIEERFTEAQTRVNQLTQAILAKAFRGELTADWREKHPELIGGESSAEALLERIRVERKGNEISKPTRKKRVVSPKRSALMTKSRHDEDVWHKPYLSSILEKGQESLTIEELFQKSGLPVEDFYKQLAWESDQGYLPEWAGGPEVI